MRRRKVLQNDRGEWAIIGGQWWEPSLFNTWAEAMEYADRQAQPTPNTITIEDPSGALCDLTATVTDQGYIRLKAGDDAFILASHEWKPLAGFLLGAAKYKEEA